MNHLTRAASGIVLIAAALSQGCSSSDGPTRHTVSGTVTYDGQPVPMGDITFAPDAEQGNDGPGSSARIVDGRFKTDSQHGVLGGPYVVRIVAFDGVAQPQSSRGKPLLKAPYETRVTFPTEASTQTFDIPGKPGH